MPANLEMKVKLPIQLVKKEKWYVASCPALDVFTQGNTKKKARENLAEALSLFLISCFERGTLDAVLRQCGFRAAKKVTPRRSAMKQDYLNIPISLLAKSSRGKRCRA